MCCVNSVTVYPGSVTIRAGSWYYGAWAEVCPTDADCTDVTWYSNNSNIASVNASSGYIYGRSAGTTRIYAEATDGSGVRDYITVTVKSDIAVETVTLNRTSVALEKGDCINLTATVCPSNATNTAVTWRSTNTSVATVSNGVVTAKKKGTAYIYAEAADGSGASARCHVQVTEDILVSSVTVNPPSKTMRVGDSDYLCATVCPEDATEKSVGWASNDEGVATVNPNSGLVVAQGAGEATITATACDGSGEWGSCVVTVNPPILVEGVRVWPTSLTMNVGDMRERLTTSICPPNATNKRVTWCSSDDSVAEVNAYTGFIRAKKAGIVTITACTVDGGYSDSCEVWVHGKTPVFLIHGRTSNSKGVWGINNNIPSGKNDDFDSNINAEALNGRKYIEVDSQTLGTFELDNGNSDTDCPCNLGNKLLDAGYKKNVNLFAFNYPNEDAVKYSAQKFEAYINNLISYVRTSGSNEMKACFYASRDDYNNNNYKINIVGHSMGGLVARYYIENLSQDNHVDKLITICTPHWGSGYADISCGTGEIAELGMHKLCDHDLRFNSKMYGGSFSTEFECNAIFGLNQCYTGDYLLTEELLYDKTRNAKYYAIAGVDYPIAIPNDNDFTFEMPTNFTTTQQIVDYFTEMGIFSFNSTSMSIIKISPKDVGDNMVGLLSQIGWIGDKPDINTPEPKIQMEKIFIDVDTNGGNGNGIPGFEVLNLLHNKIPHRDDVIKQILYYLYE